MDLNRKYELVDFVRNYAIEELGFNVGNSFEKNENTGETYYWVFYSPKTAFRLRYAKFSSKQTIDDWKEEISSGNDVYVRKTNAYGGPGDCPVTKGLLKESVSRIAYTIVHDKWHDLSAPYLCWENRMIWEAVGNVVGFHESLNIVKIVYSKKSIAKAASDQIKSAKKKAKAVKRIGEMLHELYESGKPEDFVLSEKKMLIKRFNESYGKRLGLNIENNANLADHLMYDMLYQLAEDVYSNHSKKQAIDIYLRAMKIAKYDVMLGVEILLENSNASSQKYGKIFNVF